MKWALALLCLILLAPLALVDMPPLLDYPNHLARAVVLAAGTSDPILSRMYAAHWAVIPNLGTDLVLPPLLHLLPVHLAGRIVVGISILLPVAGTIAYSRAVFGVYSPWPLASGLVAYNATLLLGFLNFVAAIDRHSATVCPQHLQSKNLSADAGRRCTPNTQITAS